MAIEDICCYCGEKTGFDKGYTIYESFDGKYGHEWCVRKYDDENKPIEMKIEEKIKRLEGQINHYEHEKQKCRSEIEKLKVELMNAKEGHLNERNP